MGRGGALERAVCWTLIGLTLLVAAVAARDAWHRVGRVVPGFALMANAQAGVGGAPRGGLEPLDVIVAVNGRPVATTEEILAEVRRHPAGTPLAYALRRGSQPAAAVVPTRVVTPGDFARFLVDGLLPGLLVIGLAGLVFFLRPGTPESRLFLGFCLITGAVNLTYEDMMTTHRFSRVFLAVWPFTPALVLHLAATFPERRRAVDRWPWLVGVPYAASAALAVWLEVNFVGRHAPVGEIIAGYSGLASLALVASLAWTVRASPTLFRLRAPRVGAPAALAGGARV